MLSKFYVVNKLVQAARCSPFTPTASFSKGKPFAKTAPDATAQTVAEKAKNMVEMVADKKVSDRISEKAADTVQNLTQEQDVADSLKWKMDEKVNHQKIQDKSIKKWLDRKTAKKSDPKRENQVAESKILTMGDKAERNAIEGSQNKQMGQKVNTRLEKEVAKSPILRIGDTVDEKMAEQANGKLTEKMAQKINHKKDQKLANEKAHCLTLKMCDKPSQEKQLVQQKKDPIPTPMLKKEIADSPTSNMADQKGVDRSQKKSANQKIDHILAPRVEKQVGMRLVLNMGDKSDQKTEGSSDKKIMAQKPQHKGDPSLGRSEKANRKMDESSKSKLVNQKIDHLLDPRLEKLAESLCLKIDDVSDQKVETGSQKKLVNQKMDRMPDPKLEKKVPETITLKIGTKEGQQQVDDGSKMELVNQKMDRRPDTRLEKKVPEMITLKTGNKEAQKVDEGSKKELVIKKMDHLDPRPQKLAESSNVQMGDKADQKVENNSRKKGVTYSKQFPEVEIYDAVDLESLVDVFGKHILKDHPNEKAIAEAQKLKHSKPTWFTRIVNYIAGMVGAKTTPVPVKRPRVRINFDDIKIIVPADNPAAEKSMRRLVGDKTPIETLKSNQQGLQSGKKAEKGAMAGKEKKL